jgi:hypothetical protein
MFERLGVSVDFAKFGATHAGKSLAGGAAHKHVYG